MVFVDSPHEDLALEWSRFEHEPPPTYPPNTPIDWPTSFSEVRAIKSLSNIPLVVLTAGKIPEGVSTTEVALSLRLQAKLAKLSSRGKQQRVPNAGHMIPFDAPMTIVNLVREMVEAARR